MLKVNSVSFRGTETVSNNNVTEPKNDLQADKKMLGKAKVAIGSGLVALAAVGVYLVTKNAKAAKALAEEAKKFGFEDVETFKFLKENRISVTKVENATRGDVESWAKEQFKAMGLGKDPLECTCLCREQVEKAYSEAKKLQLPENCFMTTLNNADTTLANHLFVYDKLDKSMEGAVNAWKEGKVYIKKIRIE